jgi:hypothetical protein
VVARPGIAAINKTVVVIEGYLNHDGLHRPSLRLGEVHFKYLIRI